MRKIHPEITINFSEVPFSPVEQSRLIKIYTFDQIPWCEDLLDELAKYSGEETKAVKCLEQSIEAGKPRCWFDVDYTFDFQSLKLGSKVLYDGEQLEYVGGIPNEEGDPKRACLRDNNGVINRVVPYKDLLLDPVHHYWKSLDDEHYGPLCACGHPYGRHFDFYEKDRLYPELPSHAGCKYCDCGTWIDPAKDPIPNRLHQGFVYQIRVTKPAKGFETSAELENIKSNSTQFAAREFPVGYVFENVTLVRGGNIDIHFWHLVNGKRFSVSGFSVECYEILSKQPEQVAN